MRARNAGVEVNVFLPFGSLDMTESHEGNIQENIWVLKDFLEKGVRIWGIPNGTLTKV